MLFAKPLFRASGPRCKCGDDAEVHLDIHRVGIFACSRCGCGTYREAERVIIAARKEVDEDDDASARAQVIRDVDRAFELLLERS